MGPAELRARKSFPAQSHVQGQAVLGQPASFTDAPNTASDRGVLGVGAWKLNDHAEECSTMCGAASSVQSLKAIKRVQGLAWREFVWIDVGQGAFDRARFLKSRI